MKILNDKKILTLAIILLVFTVFYFVVVNKISYAFVTDYDANFYYEQGVKIIEQSALKYAEEHQNEFTKEENIKYVTVQELIDNSYLTADEDGNLKDPLNENETFNKRKIKIKYVDNNFEIEIEKSA